MLQTFFIRSNNLLAHFLMNERRREIKVIRYQTKGVSMDKMILAAFADRDHADAAVGDLSEAGFEPSDISVITKEDKSGAKDMADNTAEGAASGATTGAALGGLAGLLAGAGVFPALAGLFIGGPIAAALGLGGIAATAVSGAVTGGLAGGLIGALTGMGVSEETAKSYDEVVNKGGVVVGVPARDGDTDARDILESHNATDITEVEIKERAHTA